MRFLVLALCLVATTVQAQSAQDVAIARELFREGVDLAESEQWVDAADRFRRAHQLRPSPTIAFNLAIAATESGELVEATEMLRYVGLHDGLDRAMAAEATERLAALEPRLAMLELAIEGSLQGVELRLDDDELSHEAIGVTVPIDPGGLTIRALRDGDVVDERELVASEGERVAITLRVPPRPEPEPEPEPARLDITPAHVAANATPEPERVEAEPNKARRRVVGSVVGIVLVGAAVALAIALAGGGSSAPQGSLGEVDWR